MEEVIKMKKVLHKEVKKNKDLKAEEVIVKMRGIEGEDKEVNVAIDQDLPEETEVIEMTTDIVGKIEGVEMTEATEAEMREIEAMVAETTEIEDMVAGKDLKVEEGEMIEDSEAEDLEEVLVKEEVQNLRIIQEFFLVVSQVMKMKLR